MRHIGTLTSAVALISLGIVLLIDILSGSHFFYTAILFWPLILIGLGVEYILIFYSGRKKGTSEKILIDTRSIIMLGVAAIFAVAFNTTQQVRGYVQTSMMTMDSFRDKTVDVTLPAMGVGTAKRVEIYNKMGNVTIVPSSTSQMTMTIKVHTRQLSKEQIQLLSTKWKPDVQVSSYIRIDTDKLLNQDNISATDLQIAVPQGLSVQVVVSSGNVDVTDRRGNVALNAESGSITVANVQGTVKVLGNNGTADISQVMGSVDVSGKALRISLKNVSGAVQAQTTFGEIRGKGLRSGVHASTGSGRIQLQEVAGKVEAGTDNGMIEIVKASGDLKLRAADGGVSIDSYVNGSWEIDTVKGTITMKIPRSADILFLGESGRGVVKGPTKGDNITLGARVTEKMGAGFYPVTARTGDGAITVTLTDTQ